VVLSAYNRPQSFLRREGHFREPSPQTRTKSFGGHELSRPAIISPEAQAVGDSRTLSRTILHTVRSPTEQQNGAFPPFRGRGRAGLRRRGAKNPVDIDLSFRKRSPILC
jgi:hypothetical protein